MKIAAIIFIVLLVAFVTAPTIRNFIHNSRFKEVFVNVEGTGQPIVLLHGLSGSNRYWDGFAQFFGTSFKVIRPDLKGFGRSPWPASGYSAEDQSNFLRSIFPSEETTLIGHSLGSLVAIDFASKHPERIKKLILLAPPVLEDREELKRILNERSSIESIMSLDSFWATLACHIHEFLGSLSYYFMRPYISKNMPDILVKEATMHRWESYNESLERAILGAKVVEKIASLDVDYHLILGSDDKYTTRLLADPSIANKITIRGGHNFIWDNPNDTLKTLSDILKQGR